MKDFSFKLKKSEWGDKSNPLRTQWVLCEENFLHHALLS
jgi:hypothetical protein